MAEPGTKEYFMLSAMAHAMAMSSGGHGVPSHQYHNSPGAKNLRAKKKAERQRRKKNRNNK